MSLPVIMHINYCEQGQSMDEVCQKAAAWGFDGIEFRRIWAFQEEEPESYLDRLAKAFNKAGLKEAVFGYDYPDALTDETTDCDAVIEKASQFYKLATERFNIKVCNAFSGILLSQDEADTYSDYHRNGSFAATEKQWKMAAEGYKKLGKVAEGMGFRFAFETHMCYLHDLPASAKRLADMSESPAVGVNLDYGNTVYFKAEIPDIEEAIKIIGNKLFYLHLKNSIGTESGVRVPTSLADGEINHRKYLKALKQAGYNGFICIEAPRSGDREWFAQQDIKYIRALMKDVGL